MKLLRYKSFESILKFSDGVNIDTSGELRSLKLEDGWYVTGGGYLIPVNSEEKADEMVKQMIADKEAKR